MLDDAILKNMVKHEATNQLMYVLYMKQVGFITFTSTKHQVYYF